VRVYILDRRVCAYHLPNVELGVAGAQTVLHRSCSSRRSRVRSSNSSNSSSGSGSGSGSGSSSSSSSGNSSSSKLVFFERMCERG
jgi:hypothetical protein